ncbi:hypothetical protein AHAS_Ahas07G0143700 [Arachis hypogaea]
MGLGQGKEKATETPTTTDGGASSADEAGFRVPYGRQLTEAHESSARVSSEEDDLMQRSTEKVKTREADLNQPGEKMDPMTRNDANNSTRPKVSYRDSLLENLQREDKPFDPCPEIKVTKEEFDDWCKPWHASLIVKVLGKRVNLGFMEQRLGRDWVKKGKINVINMDRDYFLVHFSDEEDYSFALTRGSWMIAGHYLIVQRWRPFFLESEREVKKIAA